LNQFLETNNPYIMETLWYKNYEGKWVKSMLPATKKNLEFIRKNYALNGQCEIFINYNPFK